MLRALFEKCEICRVPVLLHVFVVHIFKVAKVMATLRRDLSAVSLLRRAKDVSLLGKKDIALILDILYDFGSCTTVLDPELGVDLLR